MARETQRRKSVRTDDDLRTSGDDVRIQEQRRFLSARGNDSAVREARALQEAFGVVTQFAGNQLDRANEAGAERAVEQAGAGGSRDENDKNARYHRVWDRLDDELSLNAAKKDIPEMLRLMDAENQPEAAVQEAITGAMEDMFKGIDLENEDHTVLAAGLLELETTLIEGHRSRQLAKLKEEQVSGTFVAAKQAYEDSFELDSAGNKIPGTGTAPYDDIAERTNTFLDGNEKMTAYWEMIYDLAIESGDPNVVRNTPKTFPVSGEPTGIDNPLRADEHRAAINAATTKQASMAKDRQGAEDDANDGARFDAQMAIYRNRERGDDVSGLITYLETIPGTELSDIAAAKNFGDSQLDEKDSRSADLPYTVSLWGAIYSGQGNPGMIMQAWSDNRLGTGPQAKEESKKMMAALEAVRKAGAAGQTQAVTQWRSILNKRYNAQLGGLLTAVNPLMTRINVDANAMYLELTSGGTSGDEAANRVFEKFDPMVDNLPAIDEKELVGRRSQGNFTGETSVTTQSITSVLEGTSSAAQSWPGVPTYVIRDRLMDEIDAGNITEQQALLINAQL